MDAIVQQEDQSLTTTGMNSFLPQLPLILNAVPLENQRLLNQQVELAAMLQSAINARQAQVRVMQSLMANSDWKAESQETAILNKVVAIARKWTNNIIR